MTTDGLSRILVAGDDAGGGIGADLAQGLAGALDKALRLTGGRDDATVDLLVSVYDRMAEEPDEVLDADQRASLANALREAAAAALERLTSDRHPAAATVRPGAIWSSDAVAVFVDAASRSHCQLLIKPLEAHASADRFLRTPEDWALMRQSPCPVLYSAAPWPAQPGCVLAAVDAGDRSHRALSREILRQACRLGALLGAEVHVATAYPDLGQASSELQVARDYDGIKADMRAARRRAIADMLTELSLEVAEIHMLEGRPARVIPATADRLQPLVTVLGTAARRGVARLVLGNTAETLMGRLDCDLLTVREPWS